MWAVAQSWDEVILAVRGMSALSLLVSLAFTIVGTWLGGVIWIRFLSVVGSPIPFISGSRLFFTGQLGKYLPGGIWNFVAHGVSGRALGLSPRVTVGAGFFLIYMLAVAGVVTIALGAQAQLHRDDLSLVFLVIAIAGAVVLLSPPFVNRVADYLVRQETSSRFSLLNMGEFFLWAVLVWVSYGVGVSMLISDGDPFMSSLLVYSAAFAFAFIAGLVVPFAPAGLGVRETALVFALSDVVGPATAVAVAILSRLIHTIADFLIAIAVMSVTHLTKGKD